MLKTLNPESGKPDQVVEKHGKYTIVLELNI